MALNGSLDDYSPAGALRVLSSSGQTGAVRFTGNAGCTAYLCDGQLYFARGEETDDALAAALVRPGRLSADAWTRAVEEAGDAPRVGELLIAHGAIEPDLLASVVLSVIYDPLITLFRDGDGRFDFEPDTMHWIGPYRGFNVEAVVNEVRRRVRAADEMSDVVPSLSAWVSPSRTLPDGAAQVTLLREDWELVTSLSGPRTIRELAGAMGRGQYSTAQVVHRLTRAGLLEVMPEPFTPELDPVHEPSAAERFAAGPEHEAEASPAPAPPVERHPDADGEPDPRWDASWVGRNPFDHPPADDGADLGVSFGPSLGGLGTGPEVVPDGGELLPRRASVREAEPRAHWAGDDEPVLAEARGEATPGLSGIIGFQDPAAELHHDDEALAAATAEPVEETEPQDPNAAWLENLYAQFIDEAAAEGKDGKARKKEALDVAFQAPEHGDNEKAGTLRRLVDALRRL